MPLCYTHNTGRSSCIKLQPSIPVTLGGCAMPWGFECAERNILCSISPSSVSSHRISRTEQTTVLPCQLCLVPATLWLSSSYFVRSDLASTQYSKDHPVVQTWIKYGNFIPPPPSDLILDCIPARSPEQLMCFITSVNTQWYCYPAFRQSGTALWIQLTMLLWSLAFFTYDLISDVFFFLLRLTVIGHSCSRFC